MCVVEFFVARLFRKEFEKIKTTGILDKGFREQVEDLENE